MPAQYDALGNYVGDYEDVQYAGTPPSQEQVQADAAAYDQGGGSYTSASPQSFRESENNSMDSLAASQAAENNYGDFTYGSSALVSQDAPKDSGSSTDSTTGKNEQVGSGSNPSSDNSSETNSSENVGRESSYTSGSNSNSGNIFGSGFQSALQTGLRAGLQAGYQSVGRILAGMGETAVAPGPSGQGYNPEKYSSGRKNPLNQYSSFNCLYTLACISTAQQNSGNFNPAQLRNIVCRTQGDWKKDNHVKVPGFGSYDYIIDDLIIATIPAMNPATGNAFATKITFKVTEPYSLGLFFLALQEGAKAGGYGNFREASYLLMIEFQGYRDGGAPFVDHSLTRLIPIKFVTIKLRASMSGSAYECEAIPYNEVAFREPFSSTTKELTVNGADVNTVLNNIKIALQQQAQGTKSVDAVDKIDIQFPEKWNLPYGTGNMISKSVIYKDYNDAGQVKFPDGNAVFDKVKQIYNNSKVKIDKEKNFQFNVGTKIQDMISAIVMRSDFIVKQLLGNNGVGSILMDPKGMVNWFRIETRVMDGAYSKSLGRQIRTMIFRVVPYQVHVSRFMPPNAKAPGYQALNQSAIRVYEYLYTGQNTDIIALDLEFNMAFYAALPGDATSRTGSDNSQVTLDGSGKPVTVKYDALSSSGDTRDGNRSAAVVGDNIIPKNEGTGSNDSKTIQGKTLEALLTQPGDMVELQMQVRGDPYYLPSSGMGNIIKQPAAGAAGYNLLEDGSMNYQSGETDIVIVIRTPIDLNPKTGLYKFSKTVDELSGLFMITEVESKFNHNKFTQTIKCFRRSAQLGSGSGIKNVLF